MHYSDIDWDDWRPSEHATLLFVLRGDEVLLIRKKRGIGAGKINGPGGKVDPGETPLQAALREVEEEVGIRAAGTAKVGEVLFQTTGGIAMRIHVFRSTGHEGEAIETDEAVPLWVPVDAIPYHEMWADDLHWYPAMLRGESFVVRTLFDDDRMLGFELLLGQRSKRYLAAPRVAE